MHDASPRDSVESNVRANTSIGRRWERLRQLELVQKGFEQLSELLRARCWRPGMFQSADPSEPTGPLLLDPIGLTGPAGRAPPPAAIAEEPKPIPVPLGSTTLAFAVSVGRTSLANRDAIVVQAASLELLLGDAVERLKEVRPNSGRIPEIETLRSAISEFRHLLSGMPPADAIAGAKALCIRDGLVSWWNHGQLSIIDRGFDMSVFVGALLLCAQAGLIPPAKLAGLIRGKHLPDALSEAVKLLASGN